MKTLGRILLILAAFALVMGITYLLVNASSSSRTRVPFDRREGAFPRPEGVDAPFPRGERADFDRDGPRGGGWMLGMFKNTGIIAILVALITVPRRFMRRKAVPSRVA